MKKFFVLVIVLPILFQSCGQRKTNLVICELHKSDFSEIISASGATQAVNTVNIMAPMNYYGSMTVAMIIPEGTHVEPGDTICILESAGLMQTLEQQLRNLDAAEADLVKQEADNALNRALLDANVKENKAVMAISELDSLQMKFAPKAKQQLMSLQLEKAHVEERKLQKKSEAAKKIDETEIRQVKSRISQASTLVQMLQDQVKSLTITAPKAGMVARAEMQGFMIYSMDGVVVQGGQYPKIGSQVSRRMPVVALPDLTEMQIVVDVQEVDYKRIQPGQKAEITVDAADKLRTTGTVKLKSLAAKMDFMGESQVKWYEVTVSVDSLHSRIPPGLSAGCEIFINNVADTVVVPTLAIFERDSLKIIYVANGDKFMKVPVETGQSNSSHTIITKGLKGTETIALMEPPQNKIQKPNTTTDE